MSNVVADLLPLSAVAILSVIAWLDVQVLQVDTMRPPVAKKVPSVTVLFTPRDVGEEETSSSVFTAISKGKKPLLGMYTQTVSKGHHFSLTDESGCCGFHYNLTLDLQNLSAVVEKARERWWRCSAG